VSIIERPSRKVTWKTTTWEAKEFLDGGRKGRVHWALIVNQAKETSSRRGKGWGAKTRAKETLLESPAATVGSPYHSLNLAWKGAQKRKKEPRDLGGGFWKRPAGYTEG